jgi:hypothetical protein
MGAFQAPLAIARRAVARAGPEIHNIEARAIVTAAGS